MPSPPSLILGEFSRRLDQRYRLSLPPELLGPLMAGEAAAMSPHSASEGRSPTPQRRRPKPEGRSAGPDLNEPFEAILAKERPGALSLWNAAIWNRNLQAGIALVEAKMLAGALEGRWDEVQSLARLLSTRQRPTPVAGRGRLVIPEGFREFLAVSPGEELLLVGAGVCVEIWQPQAWRNHIATQMPDFRQLFDRLSR